MDTYNIKKNPEKIQREGEKDSVHESDREGET